MIERKKTRMHTSHRKMIYGQGYVDTLKGIGSYIFQNKDLIAKPMLSAVGNIGALAFTEGSKAIIKKLAQERQTKELDNNSKQILTSLMQPATNIIGSGIKKF